MNRLYYGDCLTIMRDMPKGCVDLVYLDPPFNSNRDYSAIYQDETGQPLPDQIEAFNDLWELDEERMRAIRHMPILMREAGIDDDVAEFWKIWLNALRNTQPRLLAYLSYMTERLLPLRSILRPTGTVYLHCDPTASHYIKVMMDGIFGHGNFINEIIWQRSTGKSLMSRRLPTNHDVIFHYSMNDKYTWNPEECFIPYTDDNTPDSILKKYSGVDPDGRRYQMDNLLNPNKDRPNLEYEFLGVKRVWRWTKDRMEKAYKEGRVLQNAKGKVPRYKRYLDEQRGMPVGSVWTDIPPLNSQAKERLGYATQKPVDLLERLILAGSNEGDVIFDPFCGCATTIEAAHKLKRKWVGVDIAIHAIKRVEKVRLEDRLGLREGVDFTVEGVPHTPEGAQDLWERDKYHFQKWAIEQIDGFVTSRKTGDGGIDGRMYFSLPGEKDLQSMVLEVKGGKNVNISVVRDLRGVLERDNALMAGLIVMDDLGARKTANFKREMGEAGDLDVSGVLYPRMQMLTVPEILEGKRFLTPSVARGKVLAQPALPLG